MTTSKKQIRPTINSIIMSDNISDMERFQNEVLRPIIKLQHELIICCFQHYLKKHKISLDELGFAKKTKLIHKILKSDTQLKKELRVLIIGMVTIEEYKEYLKMYSQLNKRINNMVLQKLYYL